MSVSANSPPASNTTASVTPATPGPTNQRDQILAYCLANTEPAPHAENWAFMKRTDSVRCLKGDPVEFQQRLTARFGEDDLVAERVLLRTADGNLRLARQLSTKLFFTKFEGLPLVHARAGRFLTDLSPLRAGLIPQSRQKRTALFVPGSETDAHLLAACGIAVVLPFDFTRMRAPIARKLCDPENRAQYKFILVGFEIAKLNNKLPPKNREVIERIVTIQKAADVNSADMFALWTPEPGRWNVLCEAHKLADPQLIQSALWSMQMSDYGPLSAYQEQEWKQLEVPYGDALKRLKKELDAPAECLEVNTIKQESQRLVRAFQREYVAPMFKAAGASTDPIEAGLRWAAATALDHFTWNQPAVLAAGAAVKRQGVQNPTSLSELEFKDIKQLVDLLLKIHRAIPRGAAEVST